MCKYLIQKTAKFSILLLGAWLLGSTYSFSQTVPEPVVLYGYRLLDTDGLSYEFISFTTGNSEEVTRIHEYSATNDNNSYLRAGEYVDGDFYGYIADLTTWTYTFVKISTDTRKVSEINTSWDYFPRDMAYDYKNDVLYGLRYAVSEREIFTINMETGAKQTKCTLDRDAYTLACNSDGELFIIDKDGNLCSVNKDNGATTEIGSTGFYQSSLQENVQSLAFDHNTGRLFWARYYTPSVYDPNFVDEGELIEIDLVTGEGTLLGTIANNAQIVGLYSFKTDHEIDGKLSRIITPESGKLTNSEEVKVLIQNNGTKPLSNFNIKLEINGKIATEPFAGTILCGRQEEYTLSSSVDLSIEGTYTIKVTLVITGDEDADNDSQTKTIVHFSSKPVMLYGYKIREQVSPSTEFISFTSENPGDVTPLHNYTPTNPDFNIYAGEHVHGIFYGNLFQPDNWSSPSFVEISTDSWTVVSENTPYIFMRDMAYDYTGEGTMYGLRYRGIEPLQDPYLYIININSIGNTVINPISTLDRKAYTLACSPEGNLFIIDEEGNLCLVNKGQEGNEETIWTTTVIGSTGFAPSSTVEHVQTMSFDHNTGRLFWAMYANNEGRLIEIDPTTGIGFDRGVIAGNAQIVGLYIKPVAVAGVTLNKTEFSLAVGATEQLTPVFKPENATNQNVTWASDDENIATVSADGTVTAVGEGTATITVTTEDGGFEAECEITVEPIVSQFAVTYVVPANGTLSVIDENNDPVVSGNMVVYGTNLTITATPTAEGYYVDVLKVNDADFQNGGIYTVVSATTIECAFVLASYSITVSANLAFGGFVTGGGTDIAHGTGVTVQATANTGYEFVNWTKSGTEVSTNASYTFDAIENIVLVANFSPKTYNITISANPAFGGTVTGGGTDIAHGTGVTVQATANTGYEFVNWTKNGTEVSTNASYTFDAIEDIALVANFSLKTYNITVLANPAFGGTVTGGGTDIAHGTGVTVQATANTGYEFVNWMKNGTEVSTNASYTFDAIENIALVANFSPKTYSITISANPAFGGAVTGGGTDIAHGTGVTVQATANIGYEFVNWTKNGTEVSTNASYTFEATENVDLIAIFTQVTSAEIIDKPMANLYPNPTNGIFILHFETTGTYRVTILTTSGAIIARRTFSEQMNQMDISDYPAGTYMVVIDDGKRQSTLRIVKVN